MESVTNKVFVRIARLRMLILAQLNHNRKVTETRLLSLELKF